MSETPDAPERTSSTDTAKNASAQVFIVITPILQIGFGAYYHHQCPKQPIIPIYLEVMGVCSLLMFVFSFLFKKIKPKWLKVAVISLTVVSLFALFIYGNVLIFSMYEHNNNSTITHLGPYCNKTLYRFAFWSTALTYVPIALIFLTICCTCCCFVCRVSNDLPHHQVIT